MNTLSEARILDLHPWARRRVSPTFLYGSPPHRMQSNQAFQNEAKIWHNWKALGKIGAQIISHTFRIFAELFR